MKILFLEDDPIISDIIIEYFEQKKYLTHHTYDISNALDLIEKNTYDLYLLDVNVSDGNGFEFLESLRNSGNKTPAIFITALSDIKDMKKGFKSGCDDYIKKPFELDELELRIDNIIRIYKIDRDLQIGENIVLDRSKHQLLINGEVKNIREKELKILEYLVKNESKTVSNEELCLNLWAYEDTPTEATIRTYIKNIRNLIGSEKIQTVKGVGYRFIKS